MITTKFGQFGGRGGGLLVTTTRRKKGKRRRVRESVGQSVYDGGEKVRQKN